VRSQAACPDVPVAPASTDAIYAFIDATVGWGAYTDQGAELYIPYFHQAATQLGYPSLRFTHLRKAGRYRKLYDPRSFVPGFGVRADRGAMADVDHWIRHRGSELVFVYGENDPWSVERFELGRGSRDSSVYVAAGSNHAASVARLTLDEQAAVTATLQRWAAPRPQ